MTPLHGTIGTRMSMVSGIHMRTDKNTLKGSTGTAVMRI